MEANQSSETALTIGILLIILLTVAGVAMGLSKKAVFYKDGHDCFFSFSPFLIVLIGVIIGAVLDKQVPRLIVVILTTVAVLADVLYVFYLAFKYNEYQWYVAIPVGVAKVVCGLLFINYALQLISPSGKTAWERMEKRASAAIVLAILTPLLVNLVNGEEVMRRRMLKPHTP